MSAMRLFARLFLVLALLAGGVAPGVAADGGGSDVAMTAPCHDQAGDPIAPAPADCCEDGGCTCDCRHHAPVGFLPAPLLPRLVVVGVSQGSPGTVLSMAGSAPEIRPPIA